MVDASLDDMINVTVIATGFESEDRMHTIAPPSNNGEKQNRDLPAFLRDKERASHVAQSMPQQKSFLKEENGGTDIRIDMDDSDIPTFLRKQID